MATPLSNILGSPSGSTPTRKRLVITTSQNWTSPATLKGGGVWVRRLWGGGGAGGGSDPNNGPGGGGGGGERSEDIFVELAPSTVVFSDCAWRRWRRMACGSSGPIRRVRRRRRSVGH